MFKKGDGEWGKFAYFKGSASALFYEPIFFSRKVNFTPFESILEFK